MNRICLVGRLTKKPELKESESGTKQATFTLAVNRPRTDQADFINCVAWNKLAETIEKYLDKGRELGVEGRLQINHYEDREGNKRSSTSVVVDNITFIGKKENKEEKTGNTSFRLDEVELTEDDYPF